MNAPEIDYNKLREGGHEYASNQLFDAAQVLAGQLDLREPPDEIIRKYPMLVVGIALLAHLDERAEERRLVKEAEFALLKSIADSAGIAVDALMGLVVGELKERWLFCHPNSTEAERKKALGYYEAMAVRGSGLKYDAK